MSGSIHTEALVEAKRLREVAEQNARNLLLEQITPTIKQMLEQELLGESLSEAEMEEDVLISPDERESEKKDRGEKEEENCKENCNENAEKDEQIQLTAESVQALAKMANSKAEHYGVRSLRIAKKLDSLHETQMNESTYGEKLHQIQVEIDKTFSDLQEDKKNNIVPENTSALIEGKLEELWEVTNQLMIPVKVRLINESNNKLTRKVSKFKVIAEEYGLTKGAKKKFGEECIKLTKEVKALLDSVAGLKEVVKDNSVNKLDNKVSGLFKEIYTMTKKFGSLNEEELKIVISGLDMDDPEGSMLSAVVEPGDELEDELDDELGGGDELGDELGGEEDMDIDEYGMYEGEEALDELLGGRTYSPGKGGLGKSRRGGARAHLSPEERSAQEKKGAEMAAAEKASRERGDIEEGDEMLEISEAMLKQELLRLKKRRAAMNEAMKAMQHSPGGGPGALDNFGGAGRELGGSVEGDLFDKYDSDDLNELDPVGTGYPVNESEEALTEDEINELLGGRTYKASGGRGRTGRAAAARARMSPEEEKAQREKMANKEKEQQQQDESTNIDAELVETIKAYKAALNDLEGRLNETQEELRKSNLSNAKLVYATKLMQNENLSEKQRLVVVEQLDKAQSVREVKKLFTALKETLEGKGDKGKLTESAQGRTILGGSSKATKTGGSTLTESEQKEFTRWGELAGFLHE